jgi:hypothetical protein
MKNKKMNEAIRRVGKEKSLEGFVENPVVKGLTGDQKKRFDTPLDVEIVMKKFRRARVMQARRGRNFITMPKCLINRMEIHKLPREVDTEKPF